MLHIGTAQTEITPEQARRDNPFGDAERAEIIGVDRMDYSC